MSASASGRISACAMRRPAEAVAEAQGRRAGANDREDVDQNKRRGAILWREAATAWH